MHTWFLLSCRITVANRLSYWHLQSRRALHFTFGLQEVHSQLLLRQVGCFSAYWRLR